MVRRHGGAQGPWEATRGLGRVGLGAALLLGCGTLDGDPIVAGAPMGSTTSSGSTAAGSGSSGPVASGTADGTNSGTVSGTSGSEGSSSSGDTGSASACGCEATDTDPRCVRLVNTCDREVRAGLTGEDPLGLIDVDVTLLPGECAAVAATEISGGRAFGRTGCVDDVCESNGNQGRGTLVQFTLSDGFDLYDVSLVDGFNLPMAMIPVGSTAPPEGDDCHPASCAADLNVVCPEGMVRTNEAGEIAYCTSACGACSACPSCVDCGDLADPVCDPCTLMADLCCTGQACEANETTMLWKSLCPDAITYAGEGTSFTCNQRLDYDIVFCP